MVKVINNNLWSPIPWGWGCGGHHHCHGGNNWMQKMFGYQMMFQMMNNMGNMFRSYVTPPQQQGGFYPGLYLGGGGGAPQSYEEYMAKAEEQQAYADLKSSWSEFKITKIGDRYYAYLKSDRTQRVEADSVDELMDGLNAYVDANPDKFRSKPAARVETPEDDDTPVDEADGPGHVDGAGDPPVSPQTDGGASNTRRGERPPENWPASSTWYNSHFTSKNKAATSALGLVDEISYDGYTINFTDDEAKKRLANDIAKYNVSMFDADGNVIEGADWTKLNLPNSSAMKAYATVTIKNATATPTGATSQPKIATYKYKDSGGENYQRLDYNGGNRVYKKNGTSSIDDDAVFNINGQEYTISGAADTKKLDFCEITDMRSFGNDFKLIDYQTGHFNMDESFWVLGTYQRYNPQTGNSDPVQNIRKFKFNGTGPLGGCIITWDTTQKKVVLQKNGKNYIMDDIMVGNKKL